MFIISATSYDRRPYSGQDAGFPWQDLGELNYKECEWLDVYERGKIRPRDAGEGSCLLGMVDLRLFSRVVHGSFESNVERVRYSWSELLCPVNVK
jgi:hypothetical protein